MSATEITNVTSDGEFKELIKKNQNRLVVVHFYAPWAEQCKQVTGALEELSKQIQACIIAIEAEALPQIATQFNIAAVPTCILIKNGREVDRINGVDISQLATKCKSLGAASIQLNGSPAAGDTPSLNERLKSLVNTAPVMVFMKGNREQPRCGFSRTLVQILDEAGTSYQTFDILSDEEVRQGLKEYSNWPTYPQLYVKGELIGGLDIIKELKESGELKDTLDAASQ